MLVRAGLARLSCLPSWRCLSSVPRTGELRTVRQVVDAHAQHRKRYRPIDLSASWNTLGKLARQPDERCVLRAAPKLLHPLAKQTEQALPKFDARALANTVNGLAKLHASGWRASDALWKGLATHCTRCMPTMVPQGLANTAHGFAKVERREPALLDAIAEEAARRGLRDFTPQGLSNTAWAYATAGHAAPALLDAIAEVAVRRGLREFTPQGLANTAWAYAAADLPAPALFGGDAFVQRCEAERGFVPENLCQLHQWQLWQEERGAAWPPLPPALAQRCRDAFCQAVGVPSELQGDVADSLRALGLAPREEERTPQGYSLDAVVSHGGREVAVEVDGPWHFVGRTPTGATALKRRQLRAAGWALLSVPYWEWNALGSKAAKQAYLQGALEVLGQEAAAVVEGGAPVGAPLPSGAS